MIQEVKVLAIKVLAYIPDDLSWNPRIHMVEREHNSCELSPLTSICTQIKYFKN